MKIGAIIFDIYKTILDVAFPALDPETSWQTLCKTTLPGNHLPTLAQFDNDANEIMGREHWFAKAHGIPYPEVFWPKIVCKAWSTLAILPPARLDDFVFEHAQLKRTVSLMPGAASVLKALSKRGIWLGLASNAQPYTLREMDKALKTEGLDRSLFQPQLTFLSFEHGFSKPDPHVFQILAARLSAYGISTAETLIVGDREDNDLNPAQSVGFQTWHLNGITSNAGGDWQQLGAHLDTI